MCFQFENALHRRYRFCRTLKRFESVDMLWENTTAILACAREWRQRFQRTSLPRPPGPLSIASTLDRILQMYAFKCFRPFQCESVLQFNNYTFLYSKNYCDTVFVRKFRSFDAALKPCIRPARLKSAGILHVGKTVLSLRQMHVFEVRHLFSLFSFGYEGKGYYCFRRAALIRVNTTHILRSCKGKTSKKALVVKLCWGNIM